MQVYVVTLQNIQFLSVNYDTNTSTSTHFSDTDLLSNQSESSCESTVNLNLKRKGINIVFLNIQGLCGKEMCKFSEVKSMLTSVENKKLHVFAMCETKLKQHKLSSAFHIDGFRRDHLKSGGGGIIVYVRNDIIARRRTNLEINGLDCGLKFHPVKVNRF